MRTLLEKGGQIEMTPRPAETVGKLNQAAAREEAAAAAQPLKKKGGWALGMEVSPLRVLGVVPRVLGSPG